MSRFHVTQCVPFLFSWEIYFFILVGFFPVQTWIQNSAIKPPSPLPTLSHLLIAARVLDQPTYPLASFGDGKLLYVVAPLRRRETKEGGAMAALVVTKEKEEEVLLLLQQEGGGAGMDINLPLSGDHDVHAHSYVALGDHGIVERENKGRITRSLLDSDEAGELPSSSHDVQQLFQKSGRTRVLMLLLLAFFGCVAALLLVSVGVGSSDVGSQKEVVETREFSNSSFTPALALVTDTSQKGVIPYPSRRTAFHLRPEKNWISGK
jgi:hypothetical protein